MPAKAPSPPVKGARKRQKTAAVNGATATPAAASTSTPIPLPTSKTGPAAETPGKKDTKKKKTGPQAIAPAPAAAAAEPAEEAATKKKGKAGRATRNAEADDKENTTAPKEVKKRDRSKRKSEGAA